MALQPIHPNKHRIITNIEKRSKISLAPQKKFFRYRASDEDQHLADELHSIVIELRIKRNHIRSILEPRFGSSVGNETFLLFIDRTYGAAMRPTPITRQKYKYLLKALKKVKKDAISTCNITRIE